jgi:hypothetical protein
MADAIDPNAGKGEEPANDEANVAVKELAEMKARFEKLEKQSQGQSATIRKMTDALEALSKKSEEVPADEKPKGPIAAKLAELETFKKEFAKEQAKAQEKLTRARMTALMRSVEGQIAEAGVKPGLAKMASEMISARIKGQITFDDSTGEDVAVLKSGDEVMPISDFVEQFLSTDEGKELMPEKDKPSLSGIMGKGSAHLGGGKIRVTQSDMLAGRFKLEDVVAGRVVLADG